MSVHFHDISALSNWSDLRNGERVVTDHLAILAARMRSLQRRPARTFMPITPAPPTPTLSPDPCSLLTLAEAARICQVHPRTLRTWPLPFVHVGRVVRVLRIDLDAFLAAATEGNAHTDQQQSAFPKAGA